VASRYWELTVTVADDASEGLTNFVWELGAMGVLEEEQAGGAPRLRAFFPTDADPATLRARVDAYLAGLRALGFTVGDDAAVTPVADENWADAWREHFRPLPVGRRLVIAPPWETPAANGRLVITIEPGRAFGTGHHATTAGCLAALEAIVEQDAPERVIDLGTGSGILAIAAARLGVASVLAVDSDPDAVASAVANAARNQVSDRVRCLLGDASRISTVPAPLVIANMTGPAHVRLASVYPHRVAPGGRLVLGGLLDGEAAGILGALTAHGFTSRAAASQDGWTTLELTRAAGHPVRG
jgi:ribosomal protein L11 methyltransferase